MVERLHKTRVCKEGIVMLDVTVTVMWILMNEHFVSC